MHLFDPTLDHGIMITTSNSSYVKRSRAPNQLLDVRLHTIAMSGLSCVRTELFHLLIVPSLAHHPEQANRQLSGHGDFGDLSSPSHGQVEVLVPPLRNTSWPITTNSTRASEPTLSCNQLRSKSLDEH